MAVVLVIGAVAYLLVQSGTIDFNPSDLSGSGNKAIKGVKKAVKYDNRSEVVVDLDGEEAQELLNNQDFQKMIANPEFAKLMSSPEFQNMVSSPEFRMMAASPDFGKMMASPEFGKMMAAP
ncbi:MAG: hypothetical protein P8O81_01910, partial [Flavobacteriaceae bacterium]|nr:hypothetical protein [Flavobacteriaceae bacterium]